MTNLPEKVLYKKGSALLVEQPFVYALKSELKDERCDHCFFKTQLLTCTGCNTVRYCDRMCQKKGWYFHKRECGNMKRIAPRILPDAARLLARIIFKLDKGGAREQGFYSPRQFRVFMDLMSHYNEMKNDSKRLEHFESLRAVLQIFLKNDILPNSVDLLRFYGKMVVNTFSILDEEMRGIGCGIYLAASIVDHSCVPNALAVFNSTTLTLRTLVDLEVMDWSKVLISYVDLMRFPKERQKDLQDTYYFLCECSRCLDVEELSLMNGTICQNDNCREVIHGGTQDPKKKCEKCGETISAFTWEKLLEVINFTDQQLEQMKDMAYLDVCRLCLKKQEGLLSSMNLRKVRTLDIAMDGSIEMGYFEEALKYGQQLLLPFRRYYGESHPLTGILLMKLGKLALFLDERDLARGWLKAAYEVLVITHGEKHHLVREQLVSYIRQCA